MSPPDMSNISRGGGGGTGGEGGSGMMSIRERIRAMQLEREHEHDHDDENEARIGSTPATRSSSPRAGATSDDGETTRASPKVVPSWKVKAREAAAARKLREAAERLQKRREGGDDDGGGVGGVGVGVEVGTRRPNNVCASGAQYSRRRPPGIGPDRSPVDRRSDDDGEEAGPPESEGEGEGGVVVARWTSGALSGGGRRKSGARTVLPSSSLESSHSSVIAPPSHRSPPSSSALDGANGTGGSNKKSPSSFLMARQMFQARAEGGGSSTVTTSTTGTSTGMTSSSTPSRQVQVAKTRKRRQFAAGRLGDVTSGNHREGMTGDVLEEDWADDPMIDHGGNDIRSRGANVTAKGKHLRAMDFAIDFHGEDEEGQQDQPRNMEEQVASTTSTRATMMRHRSDGRSSLRASDRDKNDTTLALHDEDHSLGSTSSDGDYEAPTSPIGARGLSDLIDDQRADTDIMTTTKTTAPAAVVTPPPSAAPSSVSSSGCGRSERSSAIQEATRCDDPSAAHKPHLGWSEERRSDNALQHPFGGGSGRGDPPPQQQQQRKWRLLSPSAESVMSGEVDDPESGPAFTSVEEGRHPVGAAAIVIADGSSVVRRIPPHRDTLDADWEADCVSAPSDEEGWSSPSKPNARHRSRGGDGDEEASTGTVKMSNTQESVNSGSEQRQQGSDGGHGRGRQGGDVDSEQGQSLPSSGIFSRGGPPLGTTTPQRQPPPPEVTPPGGGQRQKGSTPFSNRYHAGGQYEKLFNVIHDVAASNLSILERMASRSVLGAYVTPKWRCGENAGTAAATDVVDLMTPTTAAATAAANDILLAEHGTSTAPPGEFVEESVAIEVEYMEDRPTFQD